PGPLIPITRCSRLSWECVPRVRDSERFASNRRSANCVVQKDACRIPQATWRSLWLEKASADCAQISRFRPDCRVILSGTDSADNFTKDIRLFKSGEGMTMTSREFYLERRRAENPAFLRVMHSVPADRADYTPHERSPSAQQIMWTMTNELRSCIDAVTKGRAEWKLDPPPALDEMKQLFESCLNDLTNEVEKIDDDSWNRTIQFSSNGKVVAEQPVG